MLEVLTGFLFQLVCFLPLLLICGLIHKNPNFRFIAFAFVVMFVDALVVSLTRKIPGLNFEGQNWNWFGKAVEFLLGVLLFSSLPKARRQLASNLADRWNVGIYAALISGGIFIGFMNPPETFNSQTFLFQLTMPSLSEEFVYRGVLFSLFTQAFAGPRSLLLSATLVTCWFGIVHGINNLNGSIQVDAASLLVTSLVGVLLISLRVCSKSLLHPILGHSIYNICIQAVAVFHK